MSEPVPSRRCRFSSIAVTLSRIIASCVTGTDVDFIPGLWPVVQAHMATPDAGDTLMNVVTGYIVDNEDAVGMRFASIDWPTFDKMVQKAITNVPALRRALAIDPEAIGHEDFARHWRAARELDIIDESREIFRYASAHAPEYLVSTSGRLLREWEPM